MGRSWITLGVMLALVVALGLWIGLRPATVEPGRERISEATPDTAREVGIEWPDRRTVVARKTDGAWHIVAPHTARADALQVERVLSLLDATAELVLPAVDLDRFGLDRPRARLTVDGVAYAFGATNPLTGNVYVQSGERVFLIEPRYAGVIPADPQALNDRRMLDPGERPVAFSFPHFEVAQRDGKWHVAPPDEELSQDDVLRWVEGWRLAAGLRAEPFDGRAPAAHIAVDLADGRRIAIGVTEREGEIAFSRYDERMRYYFFGNSARRLLAPPSAALADSRVTR